MVEVLQGPPRTSVEQVARRLRPALDRAGAERAYVFGSYARGRADLYSDLDLVVVVPTELAFFERAKELLPEVWELGLAVDVLVYTPEEWARMRAEGNSFAATVEQEGKVIYERPTR